MKNRIAVWVQNGFKCINCLPSWQHGWLGAAVHRCCPPPWGRQGLQTASLGKDQNSKYGVYWIGITFAPSKSWKVLSWTTVSQRPSTWSCSRNLLVGLYFSPFWNAGWHLSLFINLLIMLIKRNACKYVQNPKNPSNSSIISNPNTTQFKGSWETAWPQFPLHRTKQVTQPDTATPGQDSLLRRKEC